MEFTLVVSKTSTLSLSESAVFERTSYFDRLRMTVSRRKRVYNASTSASAVVVLSTNNSKGEGK